MELKYPFISKFFLTLWAAHMGGTPMPRIGRFILADDQTMRWDKFFPIAIIVVIWIVGALMNQTKQIRRGSAAAPPPPPPPSPQRQAPRPPSPPMPIAAAQAAILAQMLSKPLAPPAPKSRRAPKRPIPPKPVAAPAPVVAAVMATPSPRIEPRPTSVRLQPSALRTRFILTEILRPPLALRQPDHFADAAHLS
jgi:hypothetical protein